jgi:hypothetical protein
MEDIGPTVSGCSEFEWFDKGCASRATARRVLRMSHSLAASYRVSQKICQMDTHWLI